MSYSPGTNRLSSNSDIAFSNLADGQSLLYDSASSKWRNSIIAETAVDIRKYATAGAIGVNSQPNIADQTAFVNAYNAAKLTNRPIYVPAGHYYPQGNIHGDGLKSVTPITLIGDGPGSTYIHQAANKTIVNIRQGTPPSGTVLAADCLQGQLYVDVTSGHGIITDDYVNIRSRALFPGTNKQATIGEYARVLSINLNGVSAGVDRINLRGGLSYDYLVSDTAVVSKMSLLGQSRFEGISFVNDAVGTASNSCAISIAYSINPIIRDCEFVRQSNAAVVLWSCYGFTIDNVSWLDLFDDEASNHYGYGIDAREATSHGRVSNSYMNGGRHMLTTNAFGQGGSPLFDNGLGIPYNIVITNCLATNCTNGAFDTHPEGRQVSYVNCTVTNTRAWGISIRGKDCSVIGCTVDGVQGGPGIWVFGEAAENALVMGCTVRNIKAGNNPSTGVFRTGEGIRIEGPRSHGTRVIDCLVQNTDHQGIYIGNTTDKVRIKGCEVDTPGLSNDIDSSSGILLAGSGSVGSTGHRIMTTTIKNASTGILVKGITTDVKAAVMDYENVTSATTGTVGSL